MARNPRAHDFNAELCRYLVVLDEDLAAQVVGASCVALGLRNGLERALTVGQNDQPPVLPAAEKLFRLLVGLAYAVRLGVARLSYFAKRNGYAGSTTILLPGNAAPSTAILPHRAVCEEN